MTSTEERGGPGPRPRDGVGRRGDAEVDRRLRDYRALVDYGRAAGIGVGASLGIELELLDDGRAVWSIVPSVRGADASYTLHRGVLATLMDTAMSSAVYTALPPRTTHTTVELSTKLVAAVRVDDPVLTCEAGVAHLGRQTATAEARVITPDGTLVAHGSCLCLLFDVPDGAPHPGP